MTTVSPSLTRIVLFASRLAVCGSCSGPTNAVIVLTTGFTLSVTRPSAFTRGRQVVGSAFFSDAIGHLDCLAAPVGYPRATEFAVRFTRKDHTAAQGHSIR